MIEDIDALKLTMFFAVPGFLMNGVIGAIYPMSRPTDATLLLRCLTLSAVNFSVAILISVFFPELQLQYLIAVLPIALGLAGGLILRADLPNAIFGAAAGFALISNIPTAWDAALYKRKECAVRITLKNGKEIVGALTRDAIISLAADGRDIFLPIVYTQDASGRYVRITPHSGVLIVGAEIEHIDFY